METSLLFPPSRHSSQPYSNLPSLTGFLAQGGVITVSQHDRGVGLYREIESNRCIECTVTGDSVNGSSRLCGPAGRVEILLLSVPLRAALGFLSPPEAPPTMELKGKGQALTVYHVKR